jgi:hypothetical protein
MTEQELIELWGDGSEFGLSPNDELFMNNAFREVAMKFATKVMDIEYKEGYDDGWEDGGKNGYSEGWSEGVDSVRYGVLGD